MFIQKKKFTAIQLLNNRISKYYVIFKTLNIVKISINEKKKIRIALNLRFVYKFV